MCPHLSTSVPIRASKSFNISEHLLAHLESEGCGCFLPVDMMGVNRVVKIKIEVGVLDNRAREQVGEGWLGTKR